MLPLGITPQHSSQKNGTNYPEIHRKMIKFSSKCQIQRNSRKSRVPRDATARISQYLNSFCRQNVFMPITTSIGGVSFIPPADWSPTVAVGGATCRSTIKSIYRGVASHSTSEDVQKKRVRSVGSDLKRDERSCDKCIFPTDLGIRSLDSGGIPIHFMV